MIGLKLIAVHGGEEHEVSPTAAVFIKAERHFKQPAAALFQNPSIELMAFLAHESLRRGGTAVKPFEEWIDGLDDIQLETSDDPFPETGSSSS